MLVPGLAHFDTSIILFFSSSSTRIFVGNIFLTTDTVGFHCFYVVYST